MFIVFKAFITPELATEYLAGAVILGAAPCTTMVFVPIVKFLLGVSNVTVPYSTLFISVGLFVVIPLAGGILTRTLMRNSRGRYGDIHGMQCWLSVYRKSI